MTRRVWAAACIPIGLLTSVGPALAVCAPSAPMPALDSFIQDPGGWIAAEGKAPDLGSAALSVAAAAVNANSPSFGKALGTMLGAASSDQGRVIGHALSGLENSCTDAKDPADIADKKYISLNILPNLLSNLSANVAYGEGSGPETTSTGAGGGGGGGAGLVGAGLPTGGSNSGAVNDSATATPTAGDSLGGISPGAVGATLLGTDAVITPATVLTTPGGTGSASVSTNQ